MNLNQSCLGGCAPAQIINITYPVDDITSIGILGSNNCEYDRKDLEYSYSLDNITWACFGSYSDIAKIVENFNQDYFIKIKVKGQVNGVIKSDSSKEGFHNIDYTTHIAEGFKFDFSSVTNTANMWNPYQNMEGALQLQQEMNEVVSQMLGIQAYYFKLAPNVGSKDITFKEYTLMDVESVKLINIIVKDSQLPSSKPDFTDFGLDFMTDWEVEITKGTFATAFGPTAQPMEGDLVYIPMMKRMWMLSSAYEEKNGALMWNATTFTVSLVKYQEKMSVDLGATESMVNSFVKNKYDDLFGDEESLASGEESVSTPVTSTENLYPAYESDAMRKWMSVGNIDTIKHSLYYKGTLIADNIYRFTNPSLDSKIIYQRKYCGTDASISFIIYPTTIDIFDGPLLEVSDLSVMISQKGTSSRLYLSNYPELSVNLKNGHYNFVWFRWSKDLNLVEAGVAPYSYPQNMPLYAVQNQHYVFDMENLIDMKQLKYNQEMIIENEKDIVLHQFYGIITNIKVFDVYNDDLSQLMQQYPNHQHLIVNDTARKLLDMHGPGLK
ncbi:MAG: hypothetical protein J1F35_06165 [Erysipelotrichales bacterium]|nr:hypothetical protein [Erysipelotrichales bacterium]